MSDHGLDTLLRFRYNIRYAHLQSYSTQAIEYLLKTDMVPIKVDIAFIRESGDFAYYQDTNIPIPENCYVVGFSPNAHETGRAKICLARLIKRSIICKYYDISERIIEDLPENERIMIHGLMPDMSTALGVCFPSLESIDAKIKDLEEEEDKLRIINSLADCRLPLW
jgi:hypothetical protein